MTTAKDLNGLILAGGYSKRMGHDKALLSYHGKPQIEFAYDLLKPFCQKVFISLRPEQALLPVYQRFSQLKDLAEFNNIGPIGGIASALAGFSQSAWLVLACDLPFVTSETLRCLIEQRDPQKIATAFISTHDQLPEPLCAVWEPQSCAVIQRFLDQGIQCPRKILIKSGPKLISQQDPNWLDNVNDQQEYLQIQQKLSPKIIRKI